MRELSRRIFLVGAAAATLVPGAARATTAHPVMRVSRDPNCGCCAGWIEHVHAAGFRADVVMLNDLVPLKARLGVPERLASCHTAEIAGYVIEGHVPAAAIKRLLSERPSAIGLAVPGMPVGSPGMEVKGAADERYEVVLFGRGFERAYARFEGGREL